MQSISSELVEEFVGTIWIISKKGRGPDPLDPPLDARLVLLKMVLGFKIALCLRDRHVFMWQWLEILNVIYVLTLKQINWKMKTFFKKLEYCFLVESTKIENVTFPNKTALQEINFKTSRIGSSGTTCQELLSFWKFRFSLRRFDVLTTQMSIISYEGALSQWVSLI